MTGSTGARPRRFPKRHRPSPPSDHDRTAPTDRLPGPPSGPHPVPLPGTWGAGLSPQRGRRLRARQDTWHPPGAAGSPQTRTPASTPRGVSLEGGPGRQEGACERAVTCKRFGVCVSTCNVFFPLVKRYFHVSRFGKDSQKCTTTERNSMFGRSAVPAGSASSAVFGAGVAGGLGAHILPCHLPLLLLDLQ